MGCGISKNKKYKICDTQLVTNMRECSDDMTTQIEQLNIFRPIQSSDTSLDKKMRNPQQSSDCLNQLKLFGNVLYVSKKSDRLRKVKSVDSEIWCIRNSKLFNITTLSAGVFNVFDHIDINHSQEICEYIEHHIANGYRNGDIIYDKLTFYNTTTFPVTINIITFNNKMIEITLIPLKHVTIECNIYGIFLITYMLERTLMIEPFWMFYIKNTKYEKENRHILKKTILFETYISSHPISSQIIVKRKKYLYLKMATFSIEKMSFIDVLKHIPKIIDFINSHINIENLSLLEHFMYDCSVNERATQYKYIDCDDL